MAELDDRAQIFQGDTAEAFALMEYAVIRDPDRLAFAREVMTTALQRLVVHFAAATTTQNSGGS